MKKKQSKLERFVAIARALPVLGRLPCGHAPTVPPCDCSSDHCRCIVELDLCHCAEHWDTDEIQSVIDRLGEFFSLIDADNYRDRPPGSVPLPLLSRDSRIEAMAERVAAGLNPFNEMDAHATRLHQAKSGETVRRARNGSVEYSGYTRKSVDLWDDDLLAAKQLAEQRYQKAQRRIAA